MKKRTDFVSNSSSSSFIVHDEALLDKNELEKVESVLKNKVRPDGTLVLPDSDIGETEFGWQKVNYISMGHKINYLAIQIFEWKYNKDFAQNSEIKLKSADNLIFHFGEVIKSLFPNLNISDVVIENDELCGGYIDHESSAYMGYNREILKDRDAMEKFLVTKSYIYNDNDNDDDKERNFK